MKYEQKSSVWDECIVEEGRSMYDLEERLLDYSAEAIRLTDRLPRSEAGAHISKQLLRSSTSPLANHGEAQAAESARDFIHKLKLSLKELRETERWLKLVKRVPLIDQFDLLDKLLNETDQLIRIFVSSINTARKRNQDS